MLRYRLAFGTLMILIFVGLILLDAWIDGSLYGSPSLHRPQATLFLILICLLSVPAQLEMAGLARQTGAHLHLSISIPGSIALATAFYWPFFANNPTRFFSQYLLFSIAIILLAAFLIQALTEGTSGTIRNCSASFFSVFYLGFCCSFILGIRINHGPWTLLFYIFSIKCSDIGAYTIGWLLGCHKMAPAISPGKTWEGLAGAIAGGSIAAYSFSAFSDIMLPRQAVLFGAGLAIVGQLSDLAESMLKRDAAQKDASSTVPGFGGILDVIDSLLLPAPIAYAALLWV